MKNILLLLVVACSFSACNSDTESKGVDAVLRFYGGEAMYSKGFVRTTDEGEMEGNFYEIKLSGVDDKIWKTFESFKLPASNCAYILYKSLSAAEKHEYSFIRVVIEESNNSHKYEFASEDLAKVEQAVVLVNNSVEDMKKGDYDSFVSKGNVEAAPTEEWNKAKPLLLEVDNKYGSVKSFNLQGFSFIDRNLDSGVKRFTKLSGVLERNKQNTDCSFIVNGSSLQSHYLYGFEFKK